MDLFGKLHLNESSHGSANLSMFPYFDTAHYIVSVMASREQPGALDVSRVSPLACWFSSMLYCFGGAVSSGIMSAEPPIAPLSNGTSVSLASVIWYLVFYCPMDVVYSCVASQPLRLVSSGMKEVTRTWKVLGGVTQAHNKYKDSSLVMIAIGWARGAGGSLIGNFEQLVRGVWKPETNELLKMSYPTKVTSMGAVSFASQQTHYSPSQKQHSMLFYTIFLVVNKISSSSVSNIVTLKDSNHTHRWTGFSRLFTGWPPAAPIWKNRMTELTLTDHRSCLQPTKNRYRIRIINLQTCKNKNQIITRTTTHPQPNSNHSPTSLLQSSIHQMSN